MNDYIKKLYEALEYFNIEQFDEIYDEIKSGNIKTHVEDIVPMCKIFICDFKNMEPHQIRKVVKMTFFIIDKGSLTEGLQELVKGLEEIYKKSILSEQEDSLDFSYEDFIDEYVSMFVNSYNELDMELFGRLISNVDSQNFKLKLVEILRKSMEEYGTEDYVKNGNVLIENIKGI